MTKYLTIVSFFAALLVLPTSFADESSEQQRGADDVFLAYFDGPQDVRWRTDGIELYKEYRAITVKIDDIVGTVMVGLGERKTGSDYDSWQPDLQTLKEIELGLSSHAGDTIQSILTGTGMLLSDSFRQYYGLTLADEKFVIINGFPKHILKDYGRSEVTRKNGAPLRIVTVSDGGPSYFQACYDMKKARIVWIRYNGTA